MRQSPSKPIFKRRHPRGFTLIEILVATTVLAMMLALMLNVTDLATRTIRQASVKMDAFSSGRTAFDIVCQRLSQATLNTYLDYYDANGISRSQATNPATWTAKGYGRASDLQFLVGKNLQNPCYGQEVYFQTPEAFSGNLNYQSTQGLLNACGYYVRFCKNDSFRPDAFVTGSSVYRYRLLQAIESTENLQIFQPAGKAFNADNARGGFPLWTASLTGNSANAESVVGNAKPLADNVIAFLVWPRMSSGLDVTGTGLTKDYTYDSQANAKPQPTTLTQPVTAHQLPPIVQVTMVMIDEASASRLARKYGTGAPSEIEDALNKRFTDVTKYETDLYGTGPKDTTSLVYQLTQKHINYQILNTSVVLRQSKWSQ